MTTLDPTVIIQTIIICGAAVGIVSVIVWGAVKYSPNTCKHE